MHQMVLYRVHSPLVRQRVLKSKLIESPNGLSLPDACEQVLYLFELCRCSKRPSSDCSEHLCDTVMLRDRDLRNTENKGLRM